MGDEEKAWEREQPYNKVLTDEKREKYYWRFSLVFLALSPLTFLGILQDEMNFSLEGFNFFVVAILGVILGILGVLVPSLNMGWVFASSLTGALSGLVACVKILLQPRALIGIRLSIIGIIIGLIPLFAIITRIILKGIM